MNGSLAIKSDASIPRMGIPTQNEDSFDGITVHRGWAIMTNDAFGIVVPILNAHKGKHVVLTGHSMGGVVATYVMFRLMRDTELVVPGKTNQLVTFGATSSGNRRL